MDQTEQREEAIFAAALKLSPDQRPALLDQTCAGNATLRRRVEALLDACLVQKGGALIRGQF